MSMFISHLLKAVMFNVIKSYPVWCGHIDFLFRHLQSMLKIMFTKLRLQQSLSLLSKHGK